MIFFLKKILLINKIYKKIQINLNYKYLCESSIKINNIIILEEFK